MKSNEEIYEAIKGITTHQMLRKPLTDRGIEKFINDWKTIFG
ncbi:hypothetical protein [Clostridium yunnanense]|nr:hypothetical protein [Clostridium yunnanense]